MPISGTSLQPLTLEGQAHSYVAFVVDRLALGDACLSVLQFFPVSIISPIIRIYSSIADII